MDVLLVETDEISRSAIAAALTEAGLDVAELASAEAALSLPGAAGRPAVLITALDLGGGETDGVRFAAEALRRWPGLRVIYLSDAPRDPRGRLLGADDRVLPRSCDAARLLEIIRARGAALQAH